MNSPVRVGLDYRPALVNREGIGRYTRELVRALIQEGAGESLRLFGSTLAPSKFTAEELGLAGSKVRSVRWRVPSKWTSSLLRASSRGVDDLLGGVDLFHHTQPNLLPVRRAREVATIFDCIYLEREGWLADDGALRMERAARDQVRRAKLVFVPTHFVAGEVVARLGARAEQVVVTELGCDHAARGATMRNALASKAQPFLLSVSRVDARKNHLRMLEAFEQLVAEGMPERWIVVGPRGHGAEAFEAALKRSKARERVEWRQSVSDSELALLYAEAQAFVFASLSEGFGLPPLEAMVHGLPVVASNTTCLPEVCGDAALLVDPLDVDAIAAALRSLLREPELASDLAARGRKRAARFTWRECARKTLAAYARAGN
ncbi:MAG TPA: glycosyltransferase family 1 protein [Planctomycetota bacterium]|nr:glycosyltransferase family 1 protein [Planctomycetota bacterium]